MHQLINLNIGPYTAGEIPAPLSYEFQDANGAPLAISGWTAVFAVRKPDGSTVTLPATISGSSAVHVWADTDLSVAGTYQGEFWVGDGTNRYASRRFVWTVRDAILIPSI